MILVTILLSFLSFYVSIQATEINEHNARFKNISIIYDEHGYPSLKALKATLIEQYFNTIDTDMIFIEQVSDLMYLVKFQKDMRTTPLFYLKIVPKNMPIHKYPAIKTDIDPDTTYPIFVPDNLPITIWIESIMSYKNSSNNTKRIQAVLVINEPKIKEILNK